MTLSYRQSQQPVVLEISDIIDATQYTYRVVLKATGKPVSIRRDLAEVYPGRITVPRWLYEKIINPK